MKNQLSACEQLYQIQSLISVTHNSIGYAYDTGTDNIIKRDPLLYLTQVFDVLGIAKKKLVEATREVEDMEQDLEVIEIERKLKEKGDS